VTRARTERGIDRAARIIDCEPAALQAVIAVETNGSGFLADGRPKILFERHIFRRLTQGRFDEHPEVSHGTPGGYKGGTAEYDRLYLAAQLDGEAAVQACSWGLAQIMGFNWKQCGERSLHGFMLAMHHNEDAHLCLMAQFIRSVHADVFLRTKQWASFARIYNGPAYARNHYDTKLAAAYEREIA
jgi:hypothetical protein